MQDKSPVLLVAVDRSHGVMCVMCVICPLPDDSGDLDFSCRFIGFCFEVLRDGDIMLIYLVSNLLLHFFELWLQLPTSIQFWKREF